MLTTQPKYSYRSTRIAGSLAVYVVNHANGSIYTVTTNGHHPRCNCPHYQKRLTGTLTRCKHIAGAMAHLALSEQPAPRPAMDPARREQARKDAEALWG